MQIDKTFLAILSGRFEKTPTIDTQTSIIIKKFTNISKGSDTHVNVSGRFGGA